MIRDGSRNASERAVNRELDRNVSNTGRGGRANHSIIVLNRRRVELSPDTSSRGWEVNKTGKTVDEADEGNQLRPRASGPSVVWTKTTTT